MFTLPGRQEAALEPGERTRRRFARRQLARRWRVWRRLLIALLVAAALALSGWLVWFSPVLAVQSVEVEGIDRLSAEQVREVARVEQGQPLVRVDLALVERRVEALAPVRAATVRRSWPDGVLIEVEERVAIAVVDLGASLRGMDRDGVLFTHFDRLPEAMPRVRVVGQPDREALREAAQVVSALPSTLAQRVDHVDVETVDQISLVLRDGKVVQWGSAEQSQDKAAVLAALLSARDAQRYDVSVPGQPVTSG